MIHGVYCDPPALRPIDLSTTCIHPRSCIVTIAGTATPYKVEEETEEEVVVYVDPEEGGRVSVTAGKSACSCV